MRTQVLLAFLAGPLACSAQVQGDAVAAQAILEKNCTACHGVARMSGLDLRSRAALLKGGTKGPAVVAGNPDASLLYRAAAQIGDLKMPPGKPPLSAADLAILRKWIQTGASWADTSASHPQPAWWSFRPPVKPAVPVVTEPAWPRNPIDAFVAAKLETKGLRHAPPADRRTLIRRAYFDLIGLPPSPEKIAEFEKNPSPDAWPKLVDELLASPQYGERWARHWLDVARYADSGGFETDIFYPNAWRYRDYVIKSFNEDKPYDRFVQEQVAGDELWPDNLDLLGTYHVPRPKLAHLEARIGTGLYTLGPEVHESNMNIPKLVSEQLTDAADTTGAVFLGLTLGCARCHDHKFDPITQRDYFRMQAVFASSAPGEVQVVPRHYQQDYHQHYTTLLVVSEARLAYRRFEQSVRNRLVDEEKAKQPKEVVEAFEIPADRRTPRQEELAAPLVKAAAAIKLEERFTPEERKENQKLLDRIAKAVLALPEKDASQNIRFDGLMEIPSAPVLIHREPELIPQVHILRRGDLDMPLDAVTPGVPAVLSDAAADFPSNPLPDDLLHSRRQLAFWLTRPDHPLTARVMVNRIWLWHFGQGLVTTPNDFGRQGQVPSHPQLLDWLATEFVDSGWSIKQMHRLILLSATYRQASRFRNQENEKVDPDNRYLWRMNRSRLEGETLWDAIHWASGTLNLEMGGRSVVPPLADDELSAVGSPSQWPVNADPAQYNRRGIYILSRRNFVYPMLQAFDNPENAVSCPERDVTTVAPQALWALNNRVMFHQAQQLAARLIRETDDHPDHWVVRAWQILVGRAPTETERRQSLTLLKSLTPAGAGGLAKLCLTLFNLNEFIYVD